jgi:ATP synthase in type III secretion protein N
MNDRSIQSVVTSIREASSAEVRFPRQSAGAKVVEVIGTLIRAQGLHARVGELCKLVDASGGKPLMAEVIGFDSKGLLLAPIGDISGLSPTAQVIPTGKKHTVLVGDHLLGAVVDGFGHPIQGGQTPSDDAVKRGVNEAPPSSLSRTLVKDALPLGVRALDTMVTCAVGQRLGLFAPAGCGKSTLLGMIARGVQADVVVLALIGERGREVGEFLHRQLPPESLARTVVVVSTSDRPSAERARAAEVATTIAEHFAAQDKHVVLLLDSVTRYARALRELALAAGELPARRAYPPSVFANLPKLFERAGPLAVGQITAFYTVLEEDDQGGDPISEEVRSLLDGHIVLSRKLADGGHYPAIDVLASRSRVMESVVDHEHLHNAQHVRRLMEQYKQVELLVQVGEYQAGNDPVVDEAVQKREAIREMCVQPTDHQTDWQESMYQLQELVEPLESAGEFQQELDYEGEA